MSVVATPITPTPLTTLACDYASLVNEVAFQLYGLRPTSTDVISDNVASTNQTTDILRAIGKGLQYAYNAYEWSFLRSPVTVTTRPPYSTGTVTVDGSGNVTGIGTTFPAYSASAGGWLTIPSVGSFAVATYSSGTSLALSGYTAAAVTVASIYTLGFNSYPLPSDVDTLQGDLTYPQNSSRPPESLKSVPEVQIRQRLARYNGVGRPQMYAETTNTFDATVGSTRFVTIYPTPDAQYIFTAIGLLRTTMVDATNRYPLGAEILAPAIVESCLAAVERDFDQKDAGAPEGVHSREVDRLLAMAIVNDKQRSSPDTLGVMRGDGQEPGVRSGPRDTKILWNAGGGFSGYI